MAVCQTPVVFKMSIVLKGLFLIIDFYMNK